MHETRYIIRGGVAGRERLRLLARVMRPTTLILFERIGITQGMSCLDVGCGGGDAAVDLARIVGTGGRIVGVDIDETKLELARLEAAASQFGNIEFRRSEIGTDSLGTGFDVVYSRFLLTHLTDPAFALAKMCQALRPGGILVVEDIDFRGSFCHPDSAAFRRYVELYTQAAQRAGTDPCIGPRLPGMLIDAGLTRVQMSVVQPAGIEGEVKVVSPLTLEGIADAVLTAGLASRQEVEQLTSQLWEIARDTRTVMSLPRIVQTWGVR